MPQRRRTIGRRSELTIRSTKTLLACTVQVGERHVSCRTAIRSVWRSLAGLTDCCRQQAVMPTCSAHHGLRIAHVGAHPLSHRFPGNLGGRAMIETTFLVLTCLTA